MDQARSNELRTGVGRPVQTLRLTATASSISWNSLRAIRVRQLAANEGQKRAMRVTRRLSTEDAPRLVRPRQGRTDRVVRDRIELSTFRFQAGVRLTDHPKCTARGSCSHVVRSEGSVNGH
jgi:hypothetical protein